MTAPENDKTPTQPAESLHPFALWRGAAIVGVLCLLFGGVVFRAYSLQVNQSEELSARAASQLAGSVQIRARRGAIVDRDGREMAVSVRAESIFVRPRQVESPRDAALRLASVLSRTEDSIYAELVHESEFRWLARRVSPQIADEVRLLGIPGVDSVGEWQRYYPMRHRAGHLLGFTGDEGFGLEGVERTFEDVLAGGVMEVEALRDAHGQPILGEAIPELEELEGAALVLTIDSRIQRIAEREIERAVLEFRARTGIAVVMDPHTGDILAMTNWPRFDPNTFRSSRPSDWRNRSVTDSWEPGSTFKIFTYAAALETGAVRPDDDIDCSNGRLRIGRHRIRDTHRDGVIPAWRVIQASSNIGAYRLASATGEDEIYSFFRQFGFGESTGIDLGGEQRGVLSEPHWAEIELANRAFGQGLTATPLQMALGYSVIANGGELMAPRLALEVRNKTGDTVQQYAPVVRRRVISERVAQLATDALVSVVDPEGTGYRAALPGILVAGKTGTAQKPDPELGGYGDIWMASFVGFVPADDPMFTIVVMIDEPQGSHYGSDVAAPTFARIAEQSLATRGVFIDRESVPSVDNAVSVVEGPIRPPTEVLDSVAPTVESGARTVVPDFAGLQLVEALTVANTAGLELQNHDWGLVRHQWPAPGASVLPGAQVDLYFRSPYAARSESSHSGANGEL